MPKIRSAKRSGWKESKSEIFSPTPVYLIGTPVKALTDKTEPPLASPSNLVTTKPVTANLSLKVLATLQIS